MKKDCKTTRIALLGGGTKRIAKADVRCIEEQRNIWGEVSVEVWMKSDRVLLSSETKSNLEGRIYGSRT